MGAQPLPFREQSDMFGLLVSGRLVDTAFRQVDQTHFVIDVHQPDSFNHVVVFLTGQTPFPDGTGGAVYMAWPPKDPMAGATQPAWQFLGVVTNDKPSAIFKVSRLNSKQPQQQPLGFTSAQGYPQMAAASAQIGISVESADALSGLAASASSVTEASSVSSAQEFSQKVIESLLNYTSSFALTPDEARLRTSETFVPFSAIQQWYTNFERRLQQNPNFWKS